MHCLVCWRTAESIFFDNNRRDNSDDDSWCENGPSCKESSQSVDHCTDFPNFCTHVHKRDLEYYNNVHLLGRYGQDNNDYEYC